MKRVLTLSCLFLLVGITGVFAQEVDYNTIILPANTTGISIEERLVQLAWRNNPKNHQVVSQSDISEYELKKAQWAWLDYIAVRSNVNEFTIDPSQDELGRAAFYPLYNISLVIPLGSIATNSLTVKQRRADVRIAEEEIKSQKLAIRAKVLTLYTRYQLAKERLKVQQEASENSQASLRLIEENFKKGMENVQIYNGALERNTTHRLRLMEAEADVKLLKIDLEEIIGVKLESVVPN